MKKKITVYTSGNRMNVSSSEGVYVSNSRIKQMIEKEKISVEGRIVTEDNMNRGCVRLDSSELLSSKILKKPFYRKEYFASVVDYILFRVINEMNDFDELLEPCSELYVKEYKPFSDEKIESIELNDDIDWYKNNMFVTSERSNYMGAIYKFFYIWIPNNIYSNICFMKNFHLGNIWFAERLGKDRDVGYLLKVISDYHDVPIEHIFVFVYVNRRKRFSKELISKLNISEKQVADLNLPDEIKKKVLEMCMKNKLRKIISK